MTAQERKEYELALREGEKRFGSPCEHKQVRNGHCVHCLRRVRGRRE